MSGTESRQATRDRVRARIGVPRVTPSRVIALLAGAVVVQLLPALPAPGFAIACAALVLALLFFRPLDRAPLWFLLGLAWTLIRADAALDARLPAALHGRDFDVVGVVRGLPDVESRSTRFEFEVESTRLDGDALALRGPVRLNWYDKAPELEPCSRWKLHLRLRPPRGLVNPGGYDSERGAVLHGVVAVGYVREDAENHRIDAPSGLCIDARRRLITAALSSQLDNESSIGLLRAIAVGDQQAIADEDWQVLRATGIGHLIAISGLHVGMFAAFGAMLARLVWKSWPRLTLRFPGPLIEAPMAMACASGYGLLAGMGVPTVRTLVMIAVALLARYARRSCTVSQALALAAMVIVIWDPLAVLSAGFWLSFCGVAVLLCVSRPEPAQRAVWRELPRLQLVLSLALLPMTVWFFGQGSLIGPFANLIAVPWISFLVVPVTVAGSLLIVDVPSVGAPLLHLADVLLKPLWQLMQWMAALPSAQVYFAATPIWALVLALIGVACMLLPRGVPARAIGVMLLIPLLVPPRQALDEGEFEAWMFDVGQGLSVFVRTRDHGLLYDAGPRYPSGFDTGDAAVVPSLHALGVGRLDRMILSHGDSDHAGGARAVHLAFPGATIESGEPDRIAVAAAACRKDETWTWDGVRFRIASAAGSEVSRSNDRSCVVLVTGSFGSLLLTGDATANVEAAEAAEADALGSVVQPLVMTVPHHGSKTASSAEFLDSIAPKQAWVSAGYRNHFGHPHADVLGRYSERSVALFNTADSGYLHLRFAVGMGAPEQGRVCREAWWRVH
jgi:competence protein ComEC